MKHTKFSGTLTFTDPETNISYDIDYRGSYEPANTRGQPDDWTPDESWLELIDLPEELKYYTDIIIAQAWRNQDA